PKGILAIRPIKYDAVLDRISPSFQRISQTELSQSHGGGSRQRFTNVITGKNFPLDDQRADSAPKQKHRRGSPCRAAAYDNDGVFSLRHWRSLSFKFFGIAATRMDFSPLFRQEIC